MTTLDVLVRSVRLEADRIISLELVRPDGGGLPAWTPGAHIDLVLPSGRVRQYSLCGDPAQRLVYRIAVLREHRGRGGSAEIHDTALVGRVLACRPPRNHFELVDASRYVFVAGGIGVTPILPMINLVAAGARPWTCYYGGRSLRSMAFVEEVLAAGSSNVTLWPEDERGLLDLPGILAQADAGVAVYCCGPEGLLAGMEAVCAEADRVGQLHTERFAQPPEAARQAGSGPVTNCAFQVVLRRSGIELQVPADRTLLDVVQEAVPTILSDCREGYCGTCETKVVEGEPEHRDTVLSDAEKAGNQVMMICVGRSRTPTLVLDI